MFGKCPKNHFWRLGSGASAFEIVLRSHNLNSRWIPCCSSWALETQMQPERLGVSCAVLQRHLCPSKPYLNNGPPGTGLCPTQTRNHLLICAQNYMIPSYVVAKNLVDWVWIWESRTMDKIAIIYGYVFKNVSVVLYH